MYEAKINKANHTITLGFQGENNARYADYDISEWVKLFGDGFASLVVIRPNETVPYIANTVQTGNTVKWVVSDVDVAIPGTGKAEFRYVKDNVIVKSETFKTEILNSVCGDEGIVTPPQQSIIDQMIQLESSTKISAQAAQASAESANQASSDAKSAVDSISGMSVNATSVSSTQQATVEKAFDPETGSLILSFGIPKGQNGKDGESPQAGVDYFTDNDKQQIVNDVIKALPDADRSQY